MSALTVEHDEAGMILDCLKAQAARQESAMGAVSASLAVLICKVESQLAGEVEVVSAPASVAVAEVEVEAEAEAEAEAEPAKSE